MFPLLRKQSGSAAPELSGWSVEGMNQAEALKVYLELRKTLAKQAKLLLEYGGKLIQETTVKEE